MYFPFKKIQFYKDRKKIQEVVLEQKRISNNLFRKMYRINKSDLKIIEDDKSRIIPIQDTIKKQLDKAFILLAVWFLNKGKNSSFPIANLVDFAHLLGNFEIDEIMFFARESTLDFETITKEKLYRTMEKFTHDIVKIPQRIVLETITALLFRYYGKSQPGLSYNDLQFVLLFREILYENRVLDSSQVEQILNEVKYLYTKEAFIDFKSLSFLVADGVSHYPK